MKRLVALGSLLVAATGCTTLPPEPDVPVHGEGGGSCNERAAQGLVGRPADNTAGFEAQRLTGARTIRWIRPGDMVTMDFSPNRLNIHLDERHRVQRLSCG
jgi:hypothetical protein